MSLNIPIKYIDENPTIPYFNTFEEKIKLSELPEGLIWDTIKIYELFTDGFINNEVESYYIEGNEEYLKPRSIASYFLLYAQRNLRNNEYIFMCGD